MRRDLYEEVGARAVDIFVAEFDDHLGDAADGADDVDRVAPWFLDWHLEHSFYKWSNEVFVLGAAFRWRRPPDAQTKRHLTAWFERVEQYGRGVEARPANERVVRAAGDGPRVLVIGASGMGSYHGEEGFRALSHPRAVFREQRFFPVQLFHPPYGGRVQRLVLRLFLGK